MENGGRANQVEEVREATDIAAVVGAYVRLRKAGRNFKALCPFHKEKTPSFLVSPERQTFHCFGCGKGGDAFTFLMEMEGVGFPEALRTLADRAGIRLTGRGDRKGRERREKLYAVLDFAARFYRAALDRPEGKEARRFLEGRGIRAETVARFGLGYAPGGWRALRDRAARAKLTDQDLLDAGLVLAKAGSTPYDRFRDRLLFPIRNVGGRVLGFGGRILGEGEPKYLNSPETELFRKGEGLYGLSATRNAIRSEGEAILVEGYTDLLALYQEGFPNVVAPLGTALTAAQARLVRNHADRVVLLFDGDEAGGRAALRSLEVLCAQGLDPRIVTLPAGTDPDQFLRERGAEPLRKAIGDAPGIVPFLLDGPYRGRKEEGLRALIRVLASLDDAIRLSVLVREASERSGVAEEVLHREVVRGRREGRVERPEEGRDAIIPRKRILDAERGIAYLGLEHPDLLPVIRKAVDPERVEDLPARKLLEALLDCAEKGESPGQSILSTTGLAGEFSRTRLEADRLEDPLPTLRDYIACVREEEIRRRMRHVQEELRDAEERKDAASCARLLEERSALAKRKRRLVAGLRGEECGSALGPPERSDSDR